MYERTSNKNYNSIYKINIYKCKEQNKVFQPSASMPGAKNKIYKKPIKNNAKITLLKKPNNIKKTRNAPKKL